MHSHMAGPAGTDPKYLTLDGILENTTWAEVFQAVGAIQAYFQAISRRFVEREKVIRQLMYAMMMREHIMIDGPAGTAKSMLIHTVFSGITDATIWEMDLTQFTTDTHLFGSYDVRQMKETGQMVHMTNGSLAEANFAQTGEFFDANDAALRALLGALNERTVRKGAQVIKLPLLTAVADTNFHPESLPDARRKKLSAVIDRFLFRIPVDYVRDPRNRLVMIEMSLDNAHTGALPPVSLADFILVSGVVRGSNLVKDPYLTQAYEEMTRIFSDHQIKAEREPISDRRLVRGAQIMEISAMLNNRKEATFEDLASTECILAHTEEEMEMLSKVRQEILGEWVKRASRREIEAELQRLNQVTKDIPKQPDLEPMPLLELQRLVDQVTVAADELQQFNSTSLEVGKQQLDVQRQLFDLRNKIHLRMVRLIESNLPDVPEQPPTNELINLKGQVNKAADMLDRIKPGSDTVFIEHTRVYESIFKLQATLRVAFDLAKPSELPPLNIPPDDPTMGG